jgi:pimeloyl-ACP methyl ester carboxylesterase
MGYLCKAIAGVLLAALAAPPALAADYRFEPGVCPFKEKSWFDPARMDCATLVATEAGATQAYRLPALRLKRADAASTAAPVVFVNGGPGGRGVTEVADWLAHPLRRRHDIILYDARGTGQATPRPCPELSARLFALIGRDLDAAGALAARRALVRECVGSVPPARRGDFSADALADDLASVGRMFGYQRLNLYAVSYGTRIAAAYARRHPQALERTLLDSVVPTAPYYGEIAANFEAALERAFLRCEADAACHARYPGFRRDYHAVAAALAARPLRWTTPAEGGRAGAAVHLDAHDFALLVQQLMYGKDFIPVLPLLFAQLRGGDSGAAPLLYEIAIGMRTRSLNFGTYYLALLNDEAQPAGAAATPAARGDELLFFRDDMAALAGLGPVVSPPAGPPAYAGPVQIVAGGLDPVTAPRYGRQLAERGGVGGNNPRYMEMAGVGHTPTLADACAGPAVAAFFAGGGFAPAPGCLAAAASGYWTGQLVQAAWPRSVIEAVFVEQSLLPLAAPGAAILLYCALIVRGVWLLWRTRKGQAADPERRRIRLATGIGVGSGVLTLLGACAVVGMTIAGPVPALLLFGFTVGTPVVAGIGGLFLLSVGCPLFVAAALARRRRQGKAADEGLKKNEDTGVIRRPAPHGH